MLEKKRNEFSPTIKFLLLIVVLLIIIGFWMPFFLTRDSFITGLDFTTTGAIGDTFGGILNPFVALAAVIVTGLAFYAQYQANKQVQDQFKLQQFESQFYKLLDFHRENVSNMEFELYKEIATGNKVFKLIINQIENAYYEILPLIQNRNIEELAIEGHIKTLNNIKNHRNNINLTQLTTLDIAYTVTFIGISNRDQYPLVRLLKDKYKVDLVKNVYHLLRLKPADFSFNRQFTTIAKNASSDVDFEKLKKEWQSSIDDEYYMGQLHQNMFYEEVNEYEVNELAYEALKNRTFIKYYGGHQFRLGHYFRNIFQTFKLIDTASFLTEEDKKSYSRIVRAQLSSYELYLLFFNSISFLGREWELSHLDNPEMHLLTKYEILKNIPDVNIYNQINIVDYYPNINYDFK